MNSTEEAAVGVSSLEIDNNLLYTAHRLSRLHVVEMTKLTEDISS